MFVSELLAIAAAACIATGGMLAGELRGQIDPLTLTRWQTLSVATLTAAAATVWSAWVTLAPWTIGLLALSGFFGIFIASSAYISAIFALGPRLALLVFSLTSPFALLMGYGFLDETITGGQLGGVALAIAGVVLAILFGRPGRVRPEGLAPPPVAALAQPAATVSVPLAVVLGLIAALGQAAGTLAARPAMQSGVDPFAAMAIRTGFSALLFLIVAALPLPVNKRRLPPSRKTLAIGISGAVIGTGVGMSLLMAALAGGKVGIVSTLSSLSPVLVLPMIWVRSGIRPPAPAWLGTLLAAAGTALIALR